MLFVFHNTCLEFCILFPSESSVLFITFRSFTSVRYTLRYISLFFWPNTKYIPSLFVHTTAKCAPSDLEDPSLRCLIYLRVQTRYHVTHIQYVITDNLTITHACFKSDHSKIVNFNYLLWATSETQDYDKKFGELLQYCKVNQKNHVTRRFFIRNQIVILFLIRSRF